MPVTASHPVFAPAPVAVPEDRWAIEDLVSPFGVVTEPQRGDTRGWLPPEVSLYVASSGDVSSVRGVDIPGPPGCGGAGRGVDDPALARRIAICEAVERYSMMHARPFEQITASAADLGAEALPLDEVARCSAAELRRPGCPLVLPDPHAPIRWVEGLELVSREPALVPLVMSHMLPTQTPQENFWLPISTGCAIHRTQVMALLSGLYETVERDALSVAWLRSLPLPRIDPATIAPSTQDLVDWYRERHIVVHLFDATTDVAIPSIYCVLEAPNDTRVAQNVACATGFDIPAIAEKAILEAAAVRAALKERLTTPRRYRDFSEPIDGAVHMARASRRKAFAFLLDDADRRPATMPVTRSFDSPEAELAHVLRLLGDKGMAVHAIDLTPREVEQVGYCVARVLVPAMQPMSLIPLAQYRGHARLTHDHPAATGTQRVRDLNPWPQPMP